MLNDICKIAATQLFPTFMSTVYVKMGVLCVLTEHAKVSYFRSAISRRTNCPSIQNILMTNNLH